ncbi:MFS transporter [Mammaliicoccus vitulinus]|uniref:MFS transporter n=1 Tax=Mammaliicoccus vitulinus TaxID=71237 RepID=UPI000F82DC95|nr:MFS transporter [Mammaliicoccus vitulinus]QQT16183.1 MFS transporter [Mammaliicoccus vitulinus]QQY18521.1 MFS transporter [Mammaliicoccus vitulinus]RTX88976.1 MFS transporter [Mammaliicoccus vitulinus]GGH97374.1 MFS transporter [Mammaliicoccus vitulinus]
MKNSKSLLIFILAVGVFGIINTEMGIIGILPSLASYFDVSVSTAGLLVSLFALAIAFAGPTMPLIFSSMNRKNVMILVLSIFIIGNVISVFTTQFSVALIARVIPAFFHPLYVAMALSVAGSSVSEQEAPKAISKVFIGVSAGMVLGVPIVSFIAEAISIQAAMSFFAIVNIFSLIATIYFVPSIPVTEKLTYGSQLKILIKGVTWISILAVLFINAAIFGVYSYLAEYLGTVTNMPSNLISVMLLIYGIANIVGNIIAGKLLADKPIVTVTAFPIALIALYLIFYPLAEMTIPTAIIILFWGILAGIGANINQYWIMSAAPQAPDFANGLFLTSVNLGTTIGTSISGIIITRLGTQEILFVGVIALIVSMVFIVMRNMIYRSEAKKV